LFSNDALVLIQADRLTVLVIFAASTREAADDSIIPDCCKEPLSVLTLVGQSHGQASEKQIPAHGHVGDVVSFSHLC
jgi:hypothetical protein